ncbi:MAG: V-type ATP synthase subunit E [Eubacterium sp.]|nr:V-type ATP synthase subunit E [Eubacterium sp.]
MISVEEKLGVFRQYLLGKQREWGKKTINAAKDTSRELVESSEEKIAEEKRSVEERSYHVIYRDKNKIIAQGKNKAKADLLEERSRILEDFKETILKEAESYVGTDIYHGYLDSCLAKVPAILGDKKEIILYTREGDRDYVQKKSAELLSDYSCDFEALPAEHIGGLMVRDKDHRINCDFSVENLIADNYKLIGMRLNEVMEKQVG